MKLGREEGLRKFGEMITILICKQEVPISNLFRDSWISWSRFSSVIPAEYWNATENEAKNAFVHSLPICSLFSFSYSTLLSHLLQSQISNMARGRTPSFVIILKYRKPEGPWLEKGIMNTQNWLRILYKRMLDWGNHSGGYEEPCLLGYNGLQDVISRMVRLFSWKTSAWKREEMRW